MQPSSKTAIARLGFTQDEADALWSGASVSDIVASASVPHYVYSTAIAVDDIVNHSEAGWPADHAAQMLAALSLLSDCISCLAANTDKFSGKQASIRINGAS